MDRAEAIRYLESMATDLTGACVAAQSDKVSQYIERKIQAVDMAIAAMREQEQSKWISDRLPTEDECNRAIVGVVNGYNGRITFTDAEIFVCYDFKEKDWYSEDYDIEGCKVRCWYVLPEPPKEGAEG